MRTRFQRRFATFIIMLGLTAPTSPWLASPAAAKALTPVPSNTLALMRARGMSASAPVVVRVFKQESELEIWKQRGDGRYALLKTFPVCRWSGRLGPKRKVGDRQAPEGFYDVTPKLMNPNSSYHLSFDTGFPNAYDRANGFTGSLLMVHGVCSSMGCYAMTNGGVEEIFSLVRDAFKGGQRAVQLQAYPFRMTAQNMARMRDDPEIDFWRQLKSGYDRFEATALPPNVKVLGKRYGFAPYKDSKIETRAVAHISEEQEAIQKQIDDGAPSVRVTYADGAMHPSFARMRNRETLGIISRPEALAFAGRDVIIRPGVKKPPAVMVAGASGAISTTFTMYWERQAETARFAGGVPLQLILPAPATKPLADAPAWRIALAHDGVGATMASSNSVAVAGNAQSARATAWSPVALALAAAPGIQ